MEPRRVLLNKQMIAVLAPLRLVLMVDIVLCYRLAVTIIRHIVTPSTVSSSFLFLLFFQRGWGGFFSCGNITGSQKEIWFGISSACFICLHAAARPTEIPEFDVYICESKYHELEHSIKRLGKGLKVSSLHCFIVETGAFRLFPAPSSLPSSPPSSCVLR